MLRSPQTITATDRTVYSVCHDMVMATVAVTTDRLYSRCHGNAIALQRFYNVFREETILDCCLLLCSTVYIMSAFYIWLPLKTCASVVLLLNSVTLIVCGIPGFRARQQFQRVLRLCSVTLVVVVRQTLQLLSDSAPIFGGAVITLGTDPHSSFTIL